MSDKEAYRPQTVREVMTAKPLALQEGTTLVEAAAAMRNHDVGDVVLLNDDYTTMEFVVKILQSVFHKPEPDAFRIMMQVHLEGSGVCGAYTARPRCGTSSRADTHPPG